MAAVATLNVRLPEDLKERGMQVLEREGVSASELIRDLFRELGETQQLPDFARVRACDRGEAEAKRAALREFVCLGRSFEGNDAFDDPRNAYREHLLRKHRPGVRV